MQTSTASTTQQTTTTQQQQRGGMATTGKGGTTTNRNTSAWRSSFLSPILYFLGSLCWLTGGALCTHNPRTGYDVDDGWFNAGVILYIIASCLFIVASLVSIISAYAEAALVKVGGRTPGIARLLILAAWHEFFGSILLLIGSAIFLGAGNSANLANATTGGGGGLTNIYPGATGTKGAGPIIMLIGAFFWLVGMLIYTVIALVVASVTALMPEMLHRQRSWFSIASTVFFTTGWLFFTIAMCCYVVLSGPGFMLFGSLLVIVAASLWIFSFLIKMFGSYNYFVPILGFATASAATTGLVAGTGAQAGISSAQVKAPLTTTTSTSTTGAGMAQQPYHGEAKETPGAAAAHIQTVGGTPGSGGASAGQMTTHTTTVAGGAAEVGPTTAAPSQVQVAV